MSVYVAAFACGIAWLQLQAALPDAFALKVLSALIFVGLALGACHRYLRAAWPVAVFLCGFVWAALLAQARLADALPQASEGRDMEVTGVVASLPQHFENGWRFEFDVERSTLPAPRHISLAWYRGYRPQDDIQADVIPDVRAGERWRFAVRLKRPHGNLNPHGFDYEAWLFERNLRATGYVRMSPGNGRLDAFVPTAGTIVERLRENVRRRFADTLGDAPHAGMLTALVIGDQQAISHDGWQTFSRTGLTHLMSISGLHVTMVAGLGYGLAGAMWRRQSKLALRLPAQQAAAVGGLLAALAYALLAGFAVPAQRTFYMLAVVALSLFMRRTLAARHSLGAALVVVLAVDPWAVLSAGFWLSFGAVSLLFYIGSGRLGDGSHLAQWGRAQWAMTVGMLPPLLALFGQFSLVSPLANAVAIPLVSFAITPLALLAVIPGLELLLWPAHGLCTWLMVLVDALAASPWAVWQQHAPPAWAVALALPGTLWLLAPRGFPARWAALALYLPLLFVPPQRPGEGQARVTVLDVGQGLAVHVQTRTHDLVFDTGPAFSPDANSGNRIIVPYLHAAGVDHLDGLMVSHQDKDHSGGAQSLLEGIPTDWLSSSLPEGHPLLVAAPAHRHCIDGQNWEWDGVRFQVLHPLVERYADPTPRTNDMSCVLRVATATTSALLTADIEARSEAEVLARHRGELRSDIMLAPHHGSRTSSTPEFIAAVDAHYIVFPVGYRNRFGHPRMDIVERYRDGRRQMFRTDHDGALSIALDDAIAVGSERVGRRRYWHGM